MMSFLSIIKVFFAGTDRTDPTTAAPVSTAHTAVIGGIVILSILIVSVAVIVVVIAVICRKNCCGFVSTGKKMR